MEDVQNFNGSGVNKSKSVLAIIALILAIIALIISWVPILNNFSFIIAILAAIFGVVAVVSVSKSHGRKSGKSIAIASIVVAVIAAVVVLASQAAYSSAVDEASKQLQDSADKMTGDATEQLLNTDIDVSLGDFTASPTTYGTYDTRLVVTATNKNSEAKSYSIKVEAVDADGKRIKDDTAYFNQLGSNQSQDVEIFKFVSTDDVESLQGATFKIMSVSQY